MRLARRGDDATYVEFLWGWPDQLAYDTHARDRTRRDEPSPPGGAYTFTEAGKAVAVLRMGDWEAMVEVGGLGARGRTAAVELLAGALRAAGVRAERVTPPS